MDPRKNDDKEFAYGSSHINPVKAADPGLVHETSEEEYINFLCKQGYNTSTLRLITGDSSACNCTELGRAWDLNYPSFSLTIEDGHRIMGIFTRTVTNVGFPNSTQPTKLASTCRILSRLRWSPLFFHSQPLERRNPFQ